MSFPVLASNSIIDLMSSLEKEKLLKKYLAKDSQRLQEEKIRAAIASLKDNENIIYLFEKEKIATDIVFSDGLSVLEFSSLIGNYDVVSYLIKNTGQSEHQKQHSLELACANQHIGMVEILVRSGVDINKSSNHGKDWLCIFSSIKNSDKTLFDFLINNKANLFVINNNGQTPKEYLANLKRKINSINM